MRIQELEIKLREINQYIKYRQFIENKNQKDEINFWESDVIRKGLDLEKVRDEKVRSNK